MNKFYVLLFILFGSFCFADDEIKKVPEFYVSPELRGLVAEYPAAVANGYVFIEKVSQAQRFFRPVPPDANFDEENILLFAWNGSTKDTIDHDIDEEGMHHFVLKTGKSNDSMEHIKIFVIKKTEDFLFHRVLE